MLMSRSVVLLIRNVTKVLHQSEPDVLERERKSVVRDFVKSVQFGSLSLEYLFT